MQFDTSVIKLEQDIMQWVYAFFLDASNSQLPGHP